MKLTDHQYAVLRLCAAGQPWRRIEGRNHRSGGRGRTLSSLTALGLIGYRSDITAKGLAELAVRPVPAATTRANSVTGDFR